MFGRRRRPRRLSSHRSAPFRSVAAFTATAVVAALCALVPATPAVAGPPVSADQDVTDIWNGLDALQSFSKGLATDGAFGTALTDLGLVPGGPDGMGFGDLFEKLVIDRLTAANPLHLSDLVSALQAASPVDLEANGRKALLSLSSQTNNGVESLPFDITVTRRVASSPLSLTTASPKFDFSAPVQVDLSFHATFTIDYDTTARTVYLAMGNAAPAITLSADAHFPCKTSAPCPTTQDSSGVHAGVGILGVSLSDGSYFDLTTNLTASLRDPNGDSRVYLGTFSAGSFQNFAEPANGSTAPGELAGGAAAAPGMVSVAFTGTPGSLHALLKLAASVDAQLPAVQLPGVSADVQIDWADITSGDPTVQVVSGLLSSIQNFENLTPKDLAQGLARLATALEGIQMSRSYTPTSGGKTGTLGADMAAGDTTAKYTKTNGSDPDTGDFFRIGDSSGPVREVTKYDSSTHTITFGSPVNDAVSSGSDLTQVDVKGNIDLPFMKGTLADVFAVNEAIVSFLNKHVKQTYNAVSGGRTGTISQASGQTAKYTVVSGAAPQNGDYYQIGTETKKVTAVSGSGPYDLTFDTAFASMPSDGTSASQVQLGDVVPDFSSLQSMLVALKTSVGLPGGSTFSIGNVGYDSATSKLAVGLGISRTQGAPIGLDPFTAVDNGTASSVGTDAATGNPTLTDNAKNWKPDVYEGRMVKSGGATNIVKTNDAHTLTFIGPWHGTAPSAGAAYQVGAQDSQVGAVSFANKLNTLSGAAGSGILNANAQIPLATVAPSYSVNLTLVLDLQAPKDGKNGTTCVGMQYNGQSNSQECPFTANNPDGTSTVVTELPTAADRIMIRTADSNGPLHILTADAPIHTAVEVDATVGFLGIHLGGTLDECAEFSSGTTCADPATASHHLVSVDFKPGLGDTQHDISLATVFAMLASDPRSLAGIDVHGEVKASLKPDITGIPGMSAADFFGSTPSFDLSMTDITDPSTISFSASGFQDALDKLKAFNFDPSNPKALFGQILQTLKILSKTLKTISGDSSSPLKQALDTKIPGLGIKLGDVFAASEQGVGDNVGYDDTHLTDSDAHFTDDLIGRLVTAGTSTGMVIAPVTATSLTIKQWQGGTPAPGAQYRVENALESAIDMLTANPADSLQQVISLLNNRLGALSVPITISVDTSGGTPTLGIQLDWVRDFHFGTPIAFDFHLGGSGANSIVGTQAEGVFEVHAKAEAKVKLLLALDPSAEGGPSDKTTLMVDPQNTSLSAGIDAGASGFLKANFGPLNISLGEPKKQGATYPAQAKAAFGVAVGSHDTSPESLSTFVGSVLNNGFQFNQGLNGVQCDNDTATDPLALCGAFPVYLSTDGGNTWKPVNTSGLDTDPPDTLWLRLPLSGDLSDEFKLTDNSGNVLPVSASDSTPRLELPSNLLADLAKGILDFSQLGQGLDGYFNFAEQALNLASFGGKLPVIGKDLQEGAQFLENVQAQIDSTLGDLASVSDTSALKTWVQDKLDTALAGVLPSGSGVDVGVICNAQLGTPTNVQTSVKTAGSTLYHYRVAATTSKGTKESVASATADAANAATLSATDTITVTWDKVDNADGYKVYRQKDGDSTWKVFDAVQADNPTFTDVGDPGSTGDPTAVTTNPDLDPCPLSDLTGVTLTADIGQGKVSDDKGCESQGQDKCIGDDPQKPLCVPLDIGVPGLSISARTNNDGTPDTSQEVCLKLGWHIHLKIGLDKNRGFFIETKDQKNPELAIGMAVSLPDTINANITFLKVHLCDFATGESQTCPFQPLVPNGVTRNPQSKTPLFAGEFGIDIHTPDATETAFDSGFTTSEDPADDIHLSDLTNLADLKKLVTVGLSAKVHIDWDFQAEIDSSLPGVGGEFKLDWAWGTQLNGVSKPTVAEDTGTDAGPPVQGNHLPDISFENVYITAGGFLSGVLKPIVQEVQKFTSPLKPVIDTLYAPIPVLSDLSHLAGGGDVTLITIAEAFSTLAGGPDLTMVERVLQVIKLINSIPTGDDNIGIFVGSFNVSGEKAIDTTATPDNTNSLIDQGSVDARSGDDVSSEMNTQSNGSLNTGKSKAGFSFPLLDHPSEVFNLLMGGDIDLVRFDSGNLTLGFSYSQQFGPVYAPPPVVITISGSASVTARIIAGFDTYGLRKAYESIKAGQSAGTVVGNILDSLFLYTTDPEKGDGKPVPVLTLQGELAAGAAVTVLIVSVGVEGGISLTINFYWHDPDNDGKFRLSEFVAAAIQNPLCLFDMEGKLSVFLRVYITFGFGPFSVTFSFTLVNVTLLDFSYHPDCAPPPPELGEVQDNVLYLFFGALGSGHQRGDPWGNSGEDESVKVHELHDENGAFTGFAVDGLNRHEEFLDSSITTVVLDARGYAGKENLVIAGDSNQSQPVKDGPPPARPFDKTAIVFGSDNDDNIKIDGGTAYVDGRGGNDTINLAGNGTAYVAGGANNDNVTVGNGDDTLAGDSGLPVTSSVTLQNHRQQGDKPPQGSWQDVANVPNGVGKPGDGEVGGDGADAILAGYGSNHIYGNGGDDTVSIATDKPLTGSETTQPGVNASKGDVIVGGTGNNNLHGGSGVDTIYAGQQWPGAETSNPNYDGVGGDGTNKVDTGLGNDTAYGGSGSDWMVGHSVSGGKDTMYGGADSDILVGGNGADQLFGGSGQDYLSGGPAKVDQLTPADPLLGDWKITPTPDGKTVDGKLLVGGDNADHIYGAGGGDEVYGDRQEDKCVLPTTGPRSTPPDETNSGSPGNDYIVGGNGDNSITGGAGNDTIFAGTGNDRLCGGADNDKLYGGPGKDNMFGGSNKDLLVAGTGNSSLYGNDGPDTILAGSGNDWIEGNAASDTIDGGSGQSVIIGGTSAAGKDDTGDTVYGGSGNNIIIGDNGTVDENGAWPDSGKPFVEPVVVHTYDLEANAPNNTAFGGNDVISGGSGDVEIYGGLGDDFIVGGFGRDHIEGNPGCDTIFGGTKDDDILGGTSPKAVAGGSVDNIPDGCDGVGNDITPADLPSTNADVVGNTIYGYLPVGPNPNHANVIVGGNGSITPIGATDPNDGAPIRTVRQLALLTIGGKDTIYGGPGPDQIFGGLGADTIRTGNGENYVEGNPGADHIYGGTGNEDILGGTSPLTLPVSGPDALTTADVPDGEDTIFADGRIAAPPGNAAQDGSDVVLGDNGCISRGIGDAPVDANGCPTGPAATPPTWQFSTADPSVQDPNGVLVRPVIRQLDVYDCPNGSCGSPDVRGTGDHIWGGTNDDLLFGEVGDDEVYGGPPTTNGLDGTEGTFVGNDYMEGGAGSDTMAGGAGDDDMLGGSAPTYLPDGRTTAMISDGTNGGNGFTLPAPANSLLTLDGSGTLGNTMDGGAGNDVMLGGNGTITHVLASGKWKKNPNDNAFIRTQVDLQLLSIGGDDTMRGGPGDDRMFGGLGVDYLVGFGGDDYAEGGPGRDALQGSAGDDDLVGGTSPIALPDPPAGKTRDDVAAGTPDGRPDQGQRLGNILCGYLCGQTTNGSDDDAVVANNGRIDRCPANNGTPQGSDNCTWTRTSYGNQKNVSSTGTAQDGGITNQSLGNPRTRFVTLLGQAPGDADHNANDYVEGNSGNDVIWGEDGSDAVHGDTPAQSSPRLDECLPTSDPTAGQDAIVGGYGNDVLCGDGGDDGVLGNRGLVTVVPFAGAKTTIGQNGGAPYGTFTYPNSGNTIYQIDLSQEYVSGVLTAVPDWNNPTATGQDQQHVIIFGGQGNDALHGSPGGDFVEGDDGMHVAGAPASTGGDDIVFTDGGDDSAQGGPGNDHLYGGDSNDDLDVRRSDSDIPLKVDDTDEICDPLKFPTITVDPTAFLTADGCPTTGFGAQSYGSRFPLAAGTYDTDPGLQDNGGTTKNSTLFGDIMYGGWNRDVMQSDNNQLGDRMIDDFGAYNLEYLCPSAYGGYQINRSLSPNLRNFLLALSQADGAVTTSTVASSGGAELSLIYSSDSKSNTGNAYPTTPGHFTC
jgi:Ca2+-binding RTX toxin-like protein